MHSKTSSFSFCADTKYNSSEVANPRPASHMWLFAQFYAALTFNYIPDVPLNNTHNNKCLVKFCHCHVGSVWVIFTINLAKQKYVREKKRWRYVHVCPCVWCGSLLQHSKKCGSWSLTGWPPLHIARHILLKPVVFNLFHAAAHFATKFNLTTPFRKF